MRWEVIGPVEVVVAWPESLLTQRITSFNEVFVAPARFGLDRCGRPYVASRRLVVSDPVLCIAKELFPGVLRDHELPAKLLPCRKRFLISNRNNILHCENSVSYRYLKNLGKNLNINLKCTSCMYMNMSRIMYTFALFFFSNLLICK